MDATEQLYIAPKPYFADGGGPGPAAGAGMKGAGEAEATGVVAAPGPGQTEGTATAPTGGGRRVEAVEFADPVPYHRHAVIAGRRVRSGASAKLAGQQAEGPSDAELADRLQGALEAEFAPQGAAVVLVDVFQEEGEAVWFLETPNGVEPPGDVFFLSEFTEDGGEVTVQEPVQVRRRSVFEPSEPETAGNTGDAVHARAREILDGLGPADRMAVMSYAVNELRRVGACGRSRR